MSDWRSYYKEHLMSAEQAVTYIKNGDRVINSHLGGAPLPIIDAMVKNAEAYQGVEISSMLTSDGQPYADEAYKDNFHCNTWFIGKNTAKALAAGYGDLTISHFSEVPHVIRNYMKPDVALIQVSPPDEHGFVSMGLSTDYMMCAAKMARTVIAEVNKQCPRVFGDTMLHVTEIECFVETDRELPEAAVPTITETEEAIGRNCAELVEDGACLQLGLGAIPDAVLAYLKDKKELGVHSEIIGDGVMNLIEEGIITGSRKELHKGKVVATSLHGSRELFRYCNDNPLIELYPVDYTNDPRIIAQHSKMVSINSCVEIDLTGQVCSEAVGPRQISGIGGQVDFVRGAKMSEGGRSIIACYATAKKGTISKIVAALKPGTPVTTSRADIDYVVTEFGIAQLRGKSLRERAKALISVAHPDFREQLKDEYAQVYGRTL